MHSLLRSVVLLFVLTFYSISTFACHCIFHRIDLEFYNDANTIFIGKVLKAKKGLFFYKMKFEVICSYKGKKHRVRMRSEYTSCGMRGLKKGDTMLMLGYRAFGVLLTDACMLNGPLHDHQKQQDTALLNRIGKLSDSLVKTEDAEGRLKHGLAHGPWKYAAKTGHSSMLGNYRKGKKDGIWTEFGDSSEIVSKEYYHRNKLKWDKNYVHGILVNETRYALRGLVEAKETDYFANGKVRRVFDNIIFGLFCTYREYYSNGKLKEKARFGPGGNYFGKSKFYNAEGKLVKKEKPKDLNRS